MDIKTDGPCRILWDNKQVANFKADGQEIEFTVLPTKGTSTLIVEHYGKNVYSEHEKFIEIIGMRINNIALKNIHGNLHNIPITASGMNLGKKMEIYT